MGTDGSVLPRPRVIAQTEISIDGAIEGFDLHMGTYYHVAARLGADAELIGSETLLAAPTVDRAETADLCRRPSCAASDHRHLWFVPDSRGRLRNLHVYRDTEWCRDVVPLVSESTPAEHLRYLTERGYDYIVAGAGTVDLRGALQEIRARYGIETLRVDSGGDLVSVLLKQRLVDEISLLIAPVLVGNAPRRMFRNLETTQTIACELIEAENLSDGLLNLRYRVKEVR